VTDVVLRGLYTARFRFLEGAGSKIRPVVVLSRPVGPFNVVSVVPLSSSSALTDADIALDDWQAAGLRVPTVVRVHRITAFLREDLNALLGTLSPGDSAKLDAALRSHLVLS
jgi:mRNA-degrading endonuclease toxin of MazEF toxin-antitoxin module